MMRLVLGLAACLFVACHADDGAPPDLGPAPPQVARAPAAPANGPLNPRLMRRFPPLEPAPVVSTAIVDLGRMLFFEKRLSQQADLACSSCHDLARYGVDALARSVGHDRQHTRRNAPSVFHAAGQIAQFWDGRSPDIVDQAGQPIVDPIEMAMPDAQHALAVLHAIPGYVAAFRAAYPGEAEPITFAHLTRAIAAFESGLVTPARWDRYLHGDVSALSADEIEGFKLFADIGCVECHTGEKLGGSMFQKAGRIVPWPDERDGGRWQVTHQAADRMVFKVPSLRNVARTGPYFHDGSVTSLDQAVIAMASHQLGVDLEPREVALITAWLGALTGDLPASYIATPTLPE